MEQSALSAAFLIKGWDIEKLLFGAASSKITSQRAEKHSRLPAMLDLGEPACSILLYQFVHLFRAAPSWHGAIIGGFRYAAQDGMRRNREPMQRSRRGAGRAV